MLSIMNALSFPLFKSFSIVSGHKGLNRPVTRTVTLDWESVEDIKKTFREGDFVISAFIAAKDGPVYAEEFIKTLIGLRVGCIAIKSIYIKEIPEYLCNLSNVKHVPIIIFSDTYTDDIVFAIRQELLSNELSASNTEKVNTLLNADNNDKQTLTLAKAINPFFYNNVICCYSLFKLQSRKNSLDSYYQQYLSKLVELSVDSKEYVVSFVKYKDGILIIFTFNDRSIDISQQFTGFLDRLGCFSNGSKNGVSSVEFHLDHLNDIMKESIYAAISCRIDNTSLKDFDKIGIDQMLIPSANTFGPRRFYENCYSILHNYDKANNMNLMETLLIYIECGRDIVLTSKKLFQHRNTIRYRLNKIKTILDLENHDDAEFQLYLFVRLYLINQLNYLLPNTVPI